MIQSSKSAPGKKGERDQWDVVLAEDDDDHAVLIEMALERASPVPVRLRRAKDGDEAIELVEEEVPDLLLLDLRMPGRSGHEVLEHVKSREHLRRIPVAVLTSSDRDEDVAKSYGLGGNHFITKPTDPAELERRLAALLKNLTELGRIHRGAGGVSATAESALDPGSTLLRTVLAWGVFVAVVGALLFYAISSGAFR